MENMKTPVSRVQQSGGGTLHLNLLSLAPLWHCVGVATIGEEPPVLSDTVGEAPYKTALATLSNGNISPRLRDQPWDNVDVAAAVYVLSADVVLPLGQGGASGDGVLGELDVSIRFHLDRHPLIPQHPCYILLTEESRSLGPSFFEQETTGERACIPAKTSGDTPVRLRPDEKKTVPARA
ncbi:hypothetical protein K503DRAFT_803485 [Rhizopogon vinicolor AM-OR11-026]|uniref:Uncharacterized protein n=1 Tax=Rhizopogon vinicolor AM-OR11-026 TaxID=1314800 RepID=A0A1B7MPP3_9AGAM|nr:hypothetical protein K503DRAFT_803485 [Rhizopogon vinicolor AM-OR11-026]